MTDVTPNPNARTERLLLRLREACDQLSRLQDDLPNHLQPYCDDGLIQLDLLGIKLREMLQ